MNRENKHQGSEAIVINLTIVMILFALILLEFLLFSAQISGFSSDFHSR